MGQIRRPRARTLQRLLLRLEQAIDLVGQRLHFAWRGYLEPRSAPSNNAAYRSAQALERSEADGDLESAAVRFEQALAVGRTVGEPGLVAASLESLARLSSARDDQDEARRMLVEAARVRESSARPAPPHEQRDIAALRSLVAS